MAGIENRDDDSVLSMFSYSREAVSLATLKVTGGRKCKAVSIPTDL